MSSLSSSRGSLHLSSFPFPTLPIQISSSNSSSSDQYSTSSSISDASFSSPSTPPSTPPSSNWNPSYLAPSGGIGRRRIMRRNSSLSSVNSSIYSEDEVDEEWTEEEEDKLKRVRTLSVCRSETPSFQNINYAHIKLKRVFFIFLSFRS